MNFEEKLQKGDCKGFSMHEMLNLGHKSLPDNSIESKIKITDICNEFRTAFSTAFINSADKNLQKEYVQKYKECTFKNDNMVELLTLNKIG